MKLPLTLAMILSSTVALWADPVTFESEDTPATLLELFTSEGCSSCPAADAWVSKLRTDAGLWKQVVPVVFHVDYWDKLGWPDRFASAANTGRQRRYAAEWRSDSIYTPGFVINGREWRAWFRRPVLPEGPTTKAGRLAITVSERGAEVTFAAADPKWKSLIVELAFLGGDLESEVKRGENSGRRLKHDFTVLHFVSATMRAEGSHFSAALPMPSKTSDAISAVAAWIIPGNAQPPIQATGGWLRKP